MSNIEFRLYYDEKGKVITYTTENLEGNYVVISKEQYSESRFDVIVNSGKIYRSERESVAYVLKTHDYDGVPCSPHDINIVVDENVKHSKWKIEINRLKKN
jgi:hypothetical protein